MVGVCCGGLPPVVALLAVVFSGSWGKLKIEAGKKGAVNTDRGTRLGSMGGGSGLNLGEGFGR